MKGKIIELPVLRWREYRQLRLQALKEVPQAFKTTYTESIIKPDSEWISRVEDAIKGETDLMFFAEYQGKLFGMLGAYFHKTPETKNSAQLWGMYVDAQYRKIGLGKELMQTILGRLQTIPSITKASLMVNVAQEAARLLYEKMGFKIVGKENFTMGDGKEHEEYIMEKELL